MKQDYNFKIAKIIIEVENKVDKERILSMILSIFITIIKIDVIDDEG